jgi:hypothetical protein
VRCTIYIVRRTQIYISDEQDAALGRRAKAMRRTKSDLIREAIDAALSIPTREEIRRALKASTGVWKDRDFDGYEYVEMIRHGRTLEDIRRERPRG